MSTLPCSVKPRLHDTTCCQTGCQTGLTTGCIVYTYSRLSNRLSNQLYNQFDNRLYRKPVVSCKRGFTAKRCQCSRKHIFYRLMNNDDVLLVESHLCATERIIRVYSTRSSIYFYVFKEVRGRVHCIQSPACCTKRNS